MSPTDRPWSVPMRLEDVPEQGRTIDIEADASTREAIAKAAGVDGIDRLAAHFDLVRQSDGLLVAGRVNATVRQTCVVTLDPLTNRIEEPIDLVFTSRHEEIAQEDEEDPTRAYVEPEPPEPLVNSTVDLGVVATEFLILGIDPYPRKPGAVFAAPEAGGEAGHPFAALAALKKKGGNVKE